MYLAATTRQTTTVVELGDDKSAGVGIEIRRSSCPSPGRPWRMTFFGDHFEAVRELNREDLEAIRDAITEVLQEA